MTARPQRRPQPGEGERPAARDLRLEMPAAHAAARSARTMVRKFAQMQGLRGEELSTLLLVLDELLSNAVDHGGGGSALEATDLARPVNMTMALHFDPQGWSMEVADQGGGDPGVIDGLMHPSAAPALDDERGRGFFILSKLLDSLSVRRSSDGLGLTVVARRTYARGR